MDLSARSDNDLLSDATTLVGSHREITAKLVAVLGEIEERRLHLVGGLSSMFDFCQKKLHLSEGEAFRRILAARLGRRFPAIHSLLASGTVNLSMLELLREKLTPENHAELFAAVAGKSKREVQTLLAARFPRSDRPSSIRPRSELEPLSAGRFRVEFTANDELRRKLELCQDLMSHVNPNRDLGVVIERAVDLLLRDLERKRRGRAKRPPNSKTANAGSTSLRVRCRAHNQLWAEQVFGREWIERRRHFRQKKSTAAYHEERRQEAMATAIAVLEKVHKALRAMGFHESEARRAIKKAMTAYDACEPLDLERALRSALLVATAA